MNLTLETLGQLEQGYFGLMFEKAVQEMLADCSQRPALDKARTLTITLQFTPVPSHEGEGKATAVKVEGKVATKTPPRVTNGEYLELKKDTSADGETVTRAIIAATPLFEAKDVN